jgi:pilus assembly protein CpaB
MKFMTIASLGASAILGIIAVFIVRGMVSSADKPTAAPSAEQVKTVPVVIAARQIAFGDALKSGHIKVVQWPKANVPEGAFSSLEPFAEENNTWRTALVRMEKNEPVLAFKVSGEGQRQSLSSQIGVDMRAFAIRTNQTSGVGGFILPGDSVDVVLVRTLEEKGGAQNKTVSDLIVQNVRVLGVDQNANAASEKTRIAKTVTVEVSAIDAQRLALAADLGELSLTLRRAGSEINANTRQVTVADLRAAPPSRIRAKHRRTRSGTTRIAVIRPESREVVSVRKLPGFAPQNTKDAKAYARVEQALEGGKQP